MSNWRCGFALDSQWQVSQGQGEGFRTITVSPAGGRMSLKSTKCFDRGCMFLYQQCVFVLA